MPTMTTEQAQQTHTLDEIRALVQHDMESVDSIIVARLHSPITLISQISQHIIHSGGKRLRPLLMLLSARAFDHQGKNHIDLAAVIEFLHTATLLHDDVVDVSDMRRGKETANNIWGNAASVLVGDFLYSLAFQIMASLDNSRVMAILAEATNTIAAGEVQQLMNRNDPDTSEANYLEVIRCKTAKLYEAAAQLGAVISNQPPQQEKAITEYGLHFGVAYQLVDDVLDYSGSAEEMGKNVGDDLAEGKPTLPLIYALNHGTQEQADLIRQTIHNGGRDNINEVIEVINETHALEYAKQMAQAHTQKALGALDTLPETPFRDALASLANLVVQRTS